MTKTAVISDCLNYRWTLTRQWDKSLKTVCFIMLNPSTADGLTDDPTIRRLIDFSKSWGYGGFEVVNLFAYRTPNPDKMWEAKRNGVDIIGSESNSYIVTAISMADKVIFAWGANGHVLNRATDIAGLVKEAFCIAASGHGFPKHPLYLKAEEKPKLIRYDSTTMKFIVPDAKHNRPEPAILRREEGRMKVW